MAIKNVKKRPIVMVSSSVYHQTDLLDAIYNLLLAMGYEVWMSHKGTIPVNSNETTIDSCLKAVAKCDLFLGIITDYYGTTVSGKFSATHLEMKKAIELNKPRWFLVNEKVVFVKNILNKLHIKNKSNAVFEKIDVNDVFIGKIDKGIPQSPFFDTRNIQMYEDAVEKVKDKTTGEITVKWVQAYKEDNDATLFVNSQFSSYEEVRNLIINNVLDAKNVQKQIKKQGVEQ